VFTCLQIPDIQYGIFATAYNKSTAGRYTGFQLYSINKKKRFNRINKQKFNLIKKLINARDSETNRRTTIMMKEVSNVIGRIH